MKWREIYITEKCLLLLLYSKYCDNLLLYLYQQTKGNNKKVPL